MARTKSTTTTKKEESTTKVKSTTAVKAKKEESMDTKINKIVEKLSEVNKVNGDVFDVLGILVSDIQDILKSKSKEQIKTQKKDCRKTIKALDKIIRNFAITPERIKLQNK
jgi:hypothetical protein